MTNESVAPVEVPETSPMGGVRLKHPAFGRVTLTRPSGQKRLFGSDLIHHSTVVNLAQRTGLEQLRLLAPQYQQIEGKKDGPEDPA